MTLASIAQDRRVQIVLAALVFTGLNALKPLVVDDTSYYYWARQIAAHPFDPYGFEIFLYQQPEPANHILAPPVLLYWLGGALSAFGEHPVAWKLSLLPFAVLLAGSLHWLLGRFARGLELPVLWMTMLSPALLPSFNLMLDVPALALGLAGVCLFIAAAERESWLLAVTAGLAAGLSMQTKYTGLSPTLALLGYAVIYGKWRLGALSGVVAAGVFIGWEIFTALQYGESHFVYAIGRIAEEGGGAAHPLAWLLGFVALAGALLPTFGVLALCAARARPALTAGVATLCTLAVAAIPLLTADRYASATALPALSNMPPEFGLLAPIGIFVIVAVAWAVLRSGAVQSASVHDPARDRIFLAFWLCLEVVGFFALSPFLAARRMVGLCAVVAVVLASRLRPGTDLPQLRWIAAWGAALGLFFAVTDLSDAHRRRSAVDLAVSGLSDLGADRDHETVWFLGHWGFQFYAERAGMRPIVPDVSRLEKGDWLVAPVGVYAQLVGIPPGVTTPMGGVEVRSEWPWSTLPSMYLGPIAIRRQPTTQVYVTLHRISADFVAPDAAPP